MRKVTLSALTAAALTLAMTLPIICRAWDECQSNVFSHRDNEDMKIALTFDDGPSDKYTLEILDILDQYGIKATFFVIGENVGYYPSIVAEEVARGHEVGNHTYTHLRLDSVNKSKQTLEGELRQTEALIFEAASYRPTLFRPPEGRYDNVAAQTAQSLNYNVILWTVDTWDWKRPSPESIVNNVMQNTKSGSIILCHDGIAHDSSTPEALRIFIPKLLEQGYQFVTVSELISE